MEAVSIRPRTVLSPLQARDRAAAFQEIVQHLSTAIGNGLALPHASIPKLPTAITALAVSPGGIEADAPDGQPVRLFYCLLVPAEDYAQHLRTVAAVTRFFRTPGIFERLHAAPTPDALLALFPG
jgi:PTS system nitrogen regulatory IIA component